MPAAPLRIPLPEAPCGALLPELRRRVALVLDDVVSPERCRAWVHGVYAAREAWTRDFGGEQFSLGRAFYTHLEQDRLAEYFAGARVSDALVENAAPGLAVCLRELLARVTGGTVVSRPDFCGPGVHVFPAGEKVARIGGVVHADTEGLPARHRAETRPALSAVLMLQAPESGGGLKLWARRDNAIEAVAKARLRGVPSYDVHYAVGTAVVFDSYTLHQIQPFAGRADRISVTLHAAETDRGLWETWF